MKKLRLSCLVLLLVFFALNFLDASENKGNVKTGKQVSIKRHLSMNETRESVLVPNESREYGASWYTNHNNNNWITNVIFNTIDNSTIWEGPPHYYGDYTAISTCVVVEQIYTLSVSFFSGQTFAQHVRTWIDWNQDEVFEASESYYLGSGFNTTLSIEITVPGGALIGETRMRVIEQSSSDPGWAGSCNGQGNHSGTYGETEDYTIFVSNSANLGYVTGLVTDSLLNPIDNALVEIGSSSATTGLNGVYTLTINPLTYSGTASAQYHNSVTVDNIVVVEADTTTVDFVLPTPLINVDMSPIILQVNPGDVVNVQRNVANVGDGVLEFNIDFDIGQGTLSPIQNNETIDLGRKVDRDRDELISTLDDNAPTSQAGITSGNRDFGDLIPFSFEPRTETGDTQCLGVEFDGEFFWVTGNFMPTNHHLYKFDSFGNLVATFIQPNFGTWGWRDLAWDGEYLYGSYCSLVDIIDPTNGQVVSSFNGPEDPNRALACDPVTGHFWTANFASNIYEFDQNGTINTYPNTQNLNIYGMAWDNVSEGGPFLWLFSQDGPSDLLISQFDPNTGQLTGVSFNGVSSGGMTESAGGCCFTTEFPTDPGISVLFVLHQSAFDDIVEGYEIGPFSWWLTVNPMSYVLQPSENIDLDITFDFTGEDIVPGTTYETIIFVENNTPDTPGIPVTISVTGVGIEGDTSGLPCEYLLAQNYPNPFNPSTTIEFSIQKESNIELLIYNIKGQIINKLAHGEFTQGSHSIIWNGRDESGKLIVSGIYFYKLIINGKTVTTKKCLLLK